MLIPSLYTATVMRFDLSDEDWTLLEPLLPRNRKSARVDDRKIMNAIFYVLRTGMPWRDLPARYGPYTTAYNRFNRWSRHGIWQNELCRAQCGIRIRKVLVRAPLARWRGPRDPYYVCPFMIGEVNRGGCLTNPSMLKIVENDCTSV